MPNPVDAGQVIAAGEGSDRSLTRDRSLPQERDRIGHCRGQCCGSAFRLDPYSAIIVYEYPENLTLRPSYHVVVVN